MTQLPRPSARHLSGELLFGDDFTPEQVAAWFQEEANGYCSLDHIDAQSDVYLYDQLDKAYFWPHLKPGLNNVLGLGSAFGSEFNAIASSIQTLTIVEPAKSFWRKSIGNLPVTYLEPHPTGRLAFADNSFDVATAFGVLHHIPNVSAVLAELLRVLTPGGRLFVREPITSMGNWEVPRKGLTKYERGLPKDFIRETVHLLKGSVVAAHVVGFAPLLKAGQVLHLDQPWNSRLFVACDRLASRLTTWNYSYHRLSAFKKSAPSIGCWVVEKNLK